MAITRQKALSKVFGDPQKKLLKKLQKTPSLEIKNTRIRVSDYQKVQLLARCYVKYRLNII